GSVVAMPSSSRSFLAALDLAVLIRSDDSRPTRCSSRRSTCSMSVILAPRWGGCGRIRPIFFANSCQPSGSCALMNSQSKSVTPPAGRQAAPAPAISMLSMTHLAGAHGADLTDVDPATATGRAGLRLAQDALRSLHG